MFDVLCSVPWKQAWKQKFWFWQKHVSPLLEKLKKIEKYAKTPIVSCRTFLPLSVLTFQGRFFLRPFYRLSLFLPFSGDSFSILPFIPLFAFPAVWPHWRLTAHWGTSFQGQYILSSLPPHIYYPIAQNGFSLLMTVALEVRQLMHRIACALASTTVQFHTDAAAAAAVSCLLSPKTKALILECGARVHGHHWKYEQ